MSVNINKYVNKVSKDIKEDRIEILKNNFPEVFSEGKIDFEKLKLSLGEEIDNRTERFNFTWAGKNNAIKTVLIPSKATLKPAKDESIKFDESENLIIEGDNLEVLKLLQKTYFGQVKMIYIDPPYNTGGDFVYHDDFTAPINSYLKQTGQLDDEGNKLSSNKETNGRYHSDWLSMMYPRLKLAWNLLKDDGVIFISIDDNEVHHLRKLLDETFGEENFIGSIIKPSKIGGGSDSKFLVKEHEYVLGYAKNSSSLPEMFIEHNADYLKRYKEQDDTGRYFWDTYARPGLATGGDDSLIYEITMPDGQIIKNRWRRSKDRYESDLKSGIVKLTKKKNGEWSVQFKQYLNDYGKKPRSLTSELGDNNEGRNDFVEVMNNAKIFEYPKPKKLVKFLCKIIGDKNATVMDFFAGSGTTAQAVLELNQEDGGNRKFILIQLPEVTLSDSEAFKVGFKTIAEITKERVRRVINGYGDNPQPINDGFKVFKLAPSNYPEISFEFDPEKSEEENKKSLSEYLTTTKQTSLLEDTVNHIDVVYENIAKEGFSLNSKIEEGSVDGNHLFIVTDGEREMRICLDSKISPESVKKLSDVEFKGKTFVCYDNALSDSDKANIGLNLELKTI